MSTPKKHAFRAVSVRRYKDRESFSDIGAAWPTAKGGFTVRLNALPVGDTILLLPFTERRKADR